MSAADPADLPAAAPRKRGYMIPGIIALAVLVLLAVLIDATHLSNSNPRQLDGPEVATRIAQQYQQAHQLVSPPPVRCPTEITVAPGRRFDCRLLRRGEPPLTVVVTQIRNGNVTFGVPG